MNETENDPLFGNRASGLFAGALTATPPAQAGTDDFWQPPAPEHLAALLPQYRIT